MTSRSVKVAAVQAAPVAFDLQQSLEKVAKFTKQAADNGADLVCFPEGFLSAYPWRYAFDATIGAREPRGTRSNLNSVGLVADILRQEMVCQILRFGY